VLEHVNFPTDMRIGGASLPPFHTLGMYVQLHYPIASLKSVSLYAPTSYHDPTIPPVISNAQNTIETIQRTKSTALVVVPAFLEEWATSPHVVQLLSELEYVVRPCRVSFSCLKRTRSLEVFAGGPLATKTGDALVAAGVKLSSVYGTTEFSPITYTFRSPTEQVLWEWVRFGPNQRIRWVAQGDGTYECQVLVRMFGELCAES
jgi:acyl-CoA synthetase (AMP-forming)/AMP-acid ligase II